MPWLLNYNEHGELSDKLTCPHCGSSELMVSGKVDYTVFFELGVNAKGEKDFQAVRELGDTTARKRIRCAECEKVVYSRAELENVGWPVPC